MAPKKTDVFEDEAITEIWMEVADLTADAGVAKEVILLLAKQFYELPWEKWKALQEAVLFDEA